VVCVCVCASVVFTG